MFDGPIGGVDPSRGSPEAARGAPDLDPGRPPGPQEPQDRPGCLRVALTLVIFLLLTVAILWLAGEVAKALGA
jgi:hypothetical protein